MCRRNSSLIMLLALLSAILFAGCPSGPVLQVSPTAVSLNGSATSALVTLSNAGSGSLTWEVGTCPSWLTLSATSGTLPGGNPSLHLESGPGGLTAGTYTGEVRIDSNGGSRTVAVVLSVVAPATLEVTPTALDFGGSESTRTLLVRNAGAGTLSWNVAGDLPAGYSLDKTSGSLTSGASETLIVTLDRGELAGGLNEDNITINSNGGSQDIALSAVVQPLQVTPLHVDFGAQLLDLTLSIANSGAVALNWTVDINELPDWLTLDTLAGTVPAGGSQIVVCSADRAYVGPGVTEAEFTVAAAGEGGTETVYVSVEGPDPVLLVTPLALDFGSTDLEQVLTIQNTGTGILDWTIEEGILDGSTWTAQDQPWLSVDESSGSTNAGTAIDITAEVDRSQSSPDEDTPHAAWLRVYSADGDEVFVPVSQLTLPATLRVLPEALDFGTVYVRRQLAIWNGGLGTVHWRIDASGKPAWASLTPVDGGGVASGDVAGSETDAVTISVDRTGYTPADDDYEWTFEVTAEDEGGAEIAGRTVRVTMNVGRTATIAIDTGTNADGEPNIDTAGTHFVPFGTREDTKSFTIANTGTAALEWEILKDTDWPEWLSSVSPMQATLQPGEMTAVTVTISRTDLSYGNKTFPMIIQSDDPENPAVPVRLEFQVPKRVIIGVNPQEIDFGLYGTSATFDVANMGDPGSMLNFEISDNKNWLYVYPETGSSEGTADLLKNWVQVNVSVDRAMLDGTGGSAELLVRAFETDSEGTRTYPIEVDEQVVEVSVEAAELSFESAWARTRIPSLVRYVLLMRDIVYEPIRLAYEDLSEVLAGFKVYENDTLIEPYETNTFLTQEDLKTDLVILLDYSGSMYASAQEVTDPAIAGAADPLQALYNECVGNLIAELPDHYNIALMEFHDRAQISRLILAPDYGPAFTSDKSALLGRLYNMNVKDHGATELLPAVVDAAAQLYFKESRAARVPFDDADVRGMLCVSDGRLTTPPGKIKDVIDVLWPTRVRFFGVGWGGDILHEPLARLAAGTGGHYYPTATVPTGEVDEDGEPVMAPALGPLMDWCDTVDPAVDPADQSIPKDLASQVVFSYVTLTEDSGVKVRLDAVFDNPNDEDPTSITGSLTQKDFDFVASSGDTNLGQISLRSDGIQPDGSARVVVRAEYMPLNVNRLQFEISCAEPFIVTQAPAESGGLVADWSMALAAGLNLVTLESPGDALPYGSYGDLVYLDFAGLAVGTELTVQFAVLDPTYGAEEFAKYFTCPDTIRVAEEPVLAPAFPTPALDVDSLFFGTDETDADIVLRNIGGSHSQTRVWLDWTAPQSGDTLTVYPSSGRLVSTTEESSIHVEFSRTGPAGDYWEFISFECACGSLNQTYVFQIPIFYTVLEPVLDLQSSSFVADNVLDFGDTEDELTFDVVNTGQSTLEWTIDATSLASWATLSAFSGDSTGLEPCEVTVWVDRTGLAAGTYTSEFTVYSSYGSETVTVSVTVLP